MRRDFGTVMQHLWSYLNGIYLIGRRLRIGRIIRSCYSATFVLCVCCIVVQERVTAQQPKIQFLGIADTSAPGVGPHVKNALSRATSAMIGRLPRDSFLEVQPSITDDRCRIDNMIDCVRNWELGANDTAVLYYAGHGATDNGATILLPHLDDETGVQLKSIIDIVKLRNPRLIVALIDACQSPIDGRIVVLREFGAGAPGEVPPLERSLYFESDPGLIVVYATELGFPVPCGIPRGNALVSEGTLFSEALYKTVHDDKLENVGWKHFVSRVKQKVNGMFDQYPRDDSGRIVLSPGNEPLSLDGQRVHAVYVSPSNEINDIVAP